MERIFHVQPDIGSPKFLDEVQAVQLPEVRSGCADANPAPASFGAFNLMPANVVGSADSGARAEQPVNNCSDQQSRRGKQGKAHALILLAAGAFATGCAGHQAMDWRPPPPPEPKDRQICDNWGCEWVTKAEFDRFMRRLEEELRGFPR